MTDKRNRFRTFLTRGLAVMTLLCMYGFALIGGSALLLGASTTSALARGGGGRGFRRRRLSRWRFPWWRLSRRWLRVRLLPLLRLWRILALLRRRGRLLCGSAARQDPLRLANPPRLGLRVSCATTCLGGPAEASSSRVVLSAGRGPLWLRSLIGRSSTHSRSASGSSTARIRRRSSARDRSADRRTTRPGWDAAPRRLRSARACGSRAGSRNRASAARHAACHATGAAKAAVADNSRPRSPIHRRDFVASRTSFHSPPHPLHGVWRS